MSLHPQQPTQEEVCRTFVTLNAMMHECEDEKEFYRKAVQLYHKATDHYNGRSAEYEKLFDTIIGKEVAHYGKTDKEILAHGKRIAFRRAWMVIANGFFKADDKLVSIKGRLQMHGPLSEKQVEEIHKMNTESAADFNEITAKAKAAIFSEKVPAMLTRGNAFLVVVITLLSTAIATCFFWWRMGVFEEKYCISAEAYRKMIGNVV